MRKPRPQPPGFVTPCFLTHRKHVRINVSCYLKLFSCEISMQHEAVRPAARSHCWGGGGGGVRDPHGSGKSSSFRAHFLSFRDEVTRPAEGGGRREEQEAASVTSGGPLIEHHGPLSSCGRPLGRASLIRSLENGFESSSKPGRKGRQVHSDASVSTNIDPTWPPPAPSTRQPRGNHPLLQ